MFTPLRTSSSSVTDAQKTLLYGHHGFGKTTQAKFMQDKYGKAFILSGESGLRSLMDVDIDYLPFTSWGLRPRGAGADWAPAAGSLMELRSIVMSPEFKAAGYKVIVLDSLTEASDMLVGEAEVKFANSNNGFEKWGEIAAELLGVVKWFRDLPYHVLVNCLAREENDPNGRTEYWPMVAGKTTQKQLPGIFDNVFCGVRSSETVMDDAGRPAGNRVTRWIVTDEYNGWHGKVRDPRRRLKTVEKCGNIAELFTRMEMPDDEYDIWTRDKAAAAGAAVTQNTSHHTNA